MLLTKSHQVVDRVQVYTIHIRLHDKRGKKKKKIEEVKTTQLVKKLYTWGPRAHPTHRDGDVSFTEDLLLHLADPFTPDRKSVV